MAGRCVALARLTLLQILIAWSISVLRLRDVSADADATGHRFHFAGGGVHSGDPAWFASHAPGKPRRVRRSDAGGTSEFGREQLVATLVVFRILYFMIRSASRSPSWYP